MYDVVTLQRSILHIKITDDEFNADLVLPSLPFKLGQGQMAVGANTLWMSIYLHHVVTLKGSNILHIKISAKFDIDRF